MATHQRDLLRKMRRTLQLTIQGDFGLCQGDAWWMDGSELVFWCPEELIQGGVHVMRVDLLQQGSTADIKARIVESYGRQAARIRHGFVHVAIYETGRPQDRHNLDELLSRLNPELGDGEYTSRTSPSASVSTSAGRSRASRARKRIAETRARRKEGAGRIQDAPRLASTGGQAPPAAEPPSTGDRDSPERESSVPSRPPSASTSGSARRMTPEAPAVAPEPTPPEPGPPSAPPASAEKKVGSRRKPAEDRVARRQREDRHRTRMTDLSRPGPSAGSRSASTKDDSREERIRRKREELRRLRSESKPQRSRASQTTTGSTSDFMRRRRLRREEALEEPAPPVRPAPPRSDPPAGERMPASQQLAGDRTRMVPIAAMVSPGDPPSLFVRFTRAEELRQAIHGDTLLPRCIVTGASTLESGRRVAVAVQLPSMVFLQLSGKVVGCEGDRATLELSSANPEDIANLLAARRG